MKNIALVGQMVASSYAFALLADRLAALGHNVYSSLPAGKDHGPELHEILTMILDGKIDVVVIGLASVEQARGEIAAAKLATELGIPWGCYADTFGGIARRWVIENDLQPNFLFVINEGEAEKAGELYPGATIVASGNPNWESFGFPPRTREEVRRELGIADGETAILAGGGSGNHCTNMAFFGTLVNAVDDPALAGHSLKLFLFPHPGEKSRHDPSVYEGFVPLSAHPLRVITKEVMPTSEAVIGMDLVVEFFSEVGIRAAHLRIPVAGWQDPIVLAHRKNLTANTDWPPYDLGAAIKVVGANGMALVIRDVAERKSFAALKRRQEQVFPTSPTPGSAIEKMVATVLEFAR